MRTASWVIVSRTTGEAIFETFNPRLAMTINQTKYEVKPVGLYLADLNRRLKEAR